MNLRPTITIWCLALLMGCSSAPAPRTYVLSPPATPIGGVRAESGRSILELKPVSVPDYLDTTDIVLRNGRNELTVSATARWGERLSIGITDALSGALARRLPGMTIVTTPVHRQPARLILVDIEAFDVFPDGRCILVARWVIEGPDRRAATRSERGSVATQVAGGPTDAAIVAAMTAAIDKLADHVAAAASLTH